MSRITQLLLSINHGEQEALAELMPLVYEELRQLALSYLRRERPDHSLQPTALVHEAYLKLIDQHSVTWQNRAHFFGIAAQLMRRILVNYAVARNTEKRGGSVEKVLLDEALDFAEDRKLNLMALNDALTDLAALDARQAQIVELRFFGGLSVEEVAEVLALSPATVKREWRTAKLWLHRQITNQ